MGKWFILLGILVVAPAYSSQADSLRILLLESKLAQVEAEKIREQRAQDLARIAEIENQVRQMATARHSGIDGRALWSAGDKVQSSIWLQVVGMGLSVLGGIGAANDSPGLAIAGSIGGTVLGISGIVQLFGAGTELKRASAVDGGATTPVNPATQDIQPHFRDGKPPGGPGSW